MGLSHEFQNIPRLANWVATPMIIRTNHGRRHTRGGSCNHTAMPQGFPLLTDMIDPVLHYLTMLFQL